jgi:hypothetical protein
MVLSYRDDGQSLPYVEVSPGGTEVLIPVARAMLLAFEGPPPEPTFVPRRTEEGPIAVDVLEWKRPVTTAKLTEREAQEIYEAAWKADETATTHKQIARRYGVSPQTVSNVKHGRTWSHATGHKRPE